MRRRALGEDGVVEGGLLGVDELEPADVEGAQAPAVERACVRRGPAAPVRRAGAGREGAGVEDRVAAEAIAGAQAENPGEGPLVLAPGLRPLGDGPGAPGALPAHGELSAPRRAH